MTIKIRAAVFLALSVGVAVGLGAFTFVYARGYSYLTNDPRACANCHVMEEYYAGWMKSPHHAAAACNDCHTPHNPLGKYAIKALNGFSHSMAFTFGPVPDAILIGKISKQVTEGTCRSCHGALTEAIDGPHAEKDMSCLRCHADVGHAPAGLLVPSAPAVASSSAH